MKPAPPPLRVGTPCPKQWDEMRGDDKRRFCEHCQLHVHNLSAMSRPERERFVTESAGQLCIAYELRVDGTMITPSFWRKISGPFQRTRHAFVAILASLLPFLFSACASSRRTLGGSKRPDHEVSKSSATANLCSVTVGVPMAPSQGEKEKAK